MIIHRAQLRQYEKTAYGDIHLHLIPRDHADFDRLSDALSELMSGLEKIDLAIGRSIEEPGKNNVLAELVAYARLVPIDRDGDFAERPLEVVIREAELLLAHQDELATDPRQGDGVRRDYFTPDAEHSPRWLMRELVRFCQLVVEVGDKNAPIFGPWKKSGQRPITKIIAEAEAVLLSPPEPTAGARPERHETWAAAEAAGDPPVIISRSPEQEFGRASFERSQQPERREPKTISQPHDWNVVRGHGKPPYVICQNCGDMRHIICEETPQPGDPGDEAMVE